MEINDLHRFKNEVLDKEPEAALPCNLSDEWLKALAWDIERGLQDEDDDYPPLAAPLAIVIQLLQGKNVNEPNERSFSEEELLEYLEYLRIEIALELVRRSMSTNINPATLETIFTNRDA